MTHRQSNRLETGAASSTGRWSGDVARAQVPRLRRSPDSPPAPDGGGRPWGVLYGSPPSDLAAFTQRQDLYHELRCLLGAATLWNMFKSRQAALYPDRSCSVIAITIDGGAYWPDGADGFFAAAGTSHADQIARYDAVIFFETAAVGGSTIEG